jgi:hypothetical protein
MRQVWPKTPRDQLEMSLAIARRSLRFWWVAAIPALLGAAGAVGIGFARGRTYESRTVIMYRELVPTRILQGPDAIGEERNIANRIQDLASSRGVLERLQQKHNLFEDIVAKDGMDEAIEEIRTRVKLKARGAGTFHLSYFGDTAEQAQEAAAGLAAILIETERDFQKEEVAATRALLGKERDRNEKELHAREQALARFLSRHPEFAEETAMGLSSAAGASIRARTQEGRRDELKDPKVLALERQRARIRERMLGAPRGGGGKGGGAAPADQDVGEARRAVADARRRVEEARARYQDRHPDVAAAAGQLARAEQRLEKARQRVTSEVRLEPISDAQRTALGKELTQVEEQIRRLERRQDAQPAVDAASSWVVELETEWARLSREVEETREQHEALEGKVFAAEIAGASGLAGEGARLVILDPATRPIRPSGLGLRILGLAGLFAFGGLGVALALGLGVADDRIGSESDLMRFGIGRALAVIPRRRRSNR